jgi:putative ABC transport system permease protein
MMMLTNYFKIATRNILKHKAFAAINIAGLAIGIAACLLLFRVVKYETSYDTFQPNYQHIYRVVTEDKTPDGSNYTPGVPIPALDALRLDVPQAKFSGLYGSYGSQVTVLGAEGENPVNEKKFIETSGMFFTDPQFFDIFHYKWLSGSPSVLSEPNTTVLTKKMAEKYFGSWQEAYGKSIKIDNAITAKVSGILEDVPLNSDFPLAVITSFESFKQNPGIYGNVTEWSHTSSNFQVFSELPANVGSKNIDALLAQFSKKHYPDIRKRVRINYLQPLSALHFDTRFGNFGDHVSSKSTLWTLSLIGVFIILMACINFINLSTAQAVGRSKEIGIRKVLGSNRRQLFAQVMGETGIIVLVSIILALGIATACLPLLRHVASIQESLGFFNAQSLLFLLAVLLLVTILSGSYPALVLSGFKPAFALKNKISSATVGGLSLRRILVILQFSISQVLIVGTIVAISQMNFVRNADLGFKKEAVYVMNVNTDSAVVSRQPAFKQKLLGLNGIESVSFSSDVPSSDNNWSTNFAFDHHPDENFHLYTKFADEDYVNTFGLDLIAGRSYSKSDTLNEVVVNETLVKKLGLKDAVAAIGKDIRTGGSYWKKIVGVVRDFKTNSLREDIKPTMIGETKQFYSVTAIKLRSSDIASTQASIASAWNEFYPEYAYTSAFMDENIREFYKQEEQMSLLYKIFAGIAVFISCLGLYGLVSFMAVQRTKEIGVRKVLGASVKNIIYLFSKEFTLLIFVGFLLAAPVAYYLMNSWLNDFVYRVPITAGVFIIAVLLSMVIAWITVGYKSVKAALANPVKSLRSE